MKRTGSVIEIRDGSGGSVRFDCGRMGEAVALVEDCGSEAIDRLMDDSIEDAFARRTYAANLRQIAAAVVASIK